MMFLWHLIFYKNIWSFEHHFNRFNDSFTLTSHIISYIWRQCSFKSNNSFLSIIIHAVWFTIHYCEYSCIYNICIERLCICVLILSISLLCWFVCFRGEWSKHFSNTCLRVGEWVCIWLWAFEWVFLLLDDLWVWVFLGLLVCNSVWLCMRVLGNISHYR